MKKKNLILGVFILATFLGVVFWQMTPKPPQPSDTPALSPEPNSSTETAIVQPPSPSEQPSVPSLEVSPIPTQKQSPQASGSTSSPIDESMNLKGSSDSSQVSNLVEKRNQIEGSSGFKAHSQIRHKEAPPLLQSEKI